MNRRDFLKAAGLGIAAMAQSASLSAGQNVSDSAILEEVDTRIEKHRKGDGVLKLIGPDGRALARGVPVKIAQKQHKFLFGCNIFKLNRCETAEDSTAYAEQFAALLNFATLPFYWWNYEHEPGEPDDARTEEIVRWCKAHNVTTKGHPLAWNYVDPRWLPKEPEEAMRLQLKRIARCVSKFKNEIDIWDVVNEATHYDREQIKKRAPVLTEAIRKMGVGPYVREAFKAARQANPHEVCERFAKFGKPLHFTELTIVSGEQGWDLRQKRRDSNFRWVTTSEGEKRQARQVNEFYTVLFSHPAVEAITWWDFTDQNAWQRAPAGLVREDMTPKPAYDELKELIKNRWWTQTEVVTEAEGEARFRGFLGDYEVAAQVGGKKLTGTFRLDETATDRIEVRMQA
ncbi:MAG: endo-1,4-beta-xylanase [Planctomycetota bacterium]|jgi:GH35 family endo-1,4-beta-xylanase